MLFKPFSFLIEIEQVSCGNHKADSCDKCPQGNGALWCHGDCAWVKGQCILHIEGYRPFLNGMADVQ